MEGGKKRQMRIRTAPVRKWQRSEERSLIEYLKKNSQEFENPTAQIYYRKFIDEYKITDIEWKLVRAKVRNMRISYGKARQWKESQDVNEGVDVRDTLTKMCSFYDDFEEIFHGTGKSEISFSLDGSVSNDYIKDENLQNDYFETSYAAEDVLTEPEMENVFHEDSNDEATTMADIENTPMQAFKKPRLDTTHSLRVEELRLQRERLEFEKLKLKQELDMKQREIDSQERLKILELEMKERISMNEIKMKERVALKALEKKWD